MPSPVSLADRPSRRESRGCGAPSSRASQGVLAPVQSASDSLRPVRTASKLKAFHRGGRRERGGRRKAVHHGEHGDHGEEMGRATVLWVTVQNEDPLLNLFFQSFSVFSVVSVVMFFVFARRLSLPSSAFSASSAVKCLLCSEALNAPSRTGRGRPRLAGPCHFGPRTTFRNTRLNGAAHPPVRKPDSGLKNSRKHLKIRPLPHRESQEKRDDFDYHSHRAGRPVFDPRTGPNRPPPGAPSEGERRLTQPRSDLLERDRATRSHGCLTT